MGRYRKSGYDLPPRVYRHRSHFRYISPSGQISNLGRDKKEALRKWAVLVTDAPKQETVAWLCDWFLTKRRSELEAAAKLGDRPPISKRTLSDYEKDLKLIKGALGHIPHAELRPHHIAKYRNARAMTAPIHVNREKAALSAVYSYAIEEGLADLNPCRGVKRRRELPRTRRVEDAEYQAVLRVAHKQVRRMMILGYRTAQRPEDLLLLGSGNVKTVQVAGNPVRVLRITQAKLESRAPVTLDIELVGELATVVDEALKDKGAPLTLVHTEEGTPYTYDGLASMFRRAVDKAKVKAYGLYDLRAKAATDLYMNGTPIEKIRELLGHASVATTMRYLKARMGKVVAPNDRELPEEEALEEAVDG